VPYGSLPGFWKFMNRVSPFTYFTGGILGAGLANTNIVCATNEYLHMTPPSGQTCEQYLSTWISQSGGYLLDPSATDSCTFCSINETNTFLAQFGIYYDQV
jgi:ATP-binding cassette subfamily G (WHITE) protein 2 (PDR)